MNTEIVIEKDECLSAKRPIEMGYCLTKIGNRPAT